MARTVSCEGNLAVGSAQLQDGNASAACVGLPYMEEIVPCAVSIVM